MIIKNTLFRFPKTFNNQPDNNVTCVEVVADLTAR